MLGLLLASGCTFPNDPLALRIREQLPAGGDEFALALRQSTRAQMRPGNRVELIQNGQVFDAIEKQIRQAQVSIHIVTFIWRDSPPSTRLVEAILERTRAGVACRIVYDPFGSPGFDNGVRQKLSSGGCDVRPFNPFGPQRPESIQHRTHRKLVVVDGRMGITGGFGIWSSWEGDGLTPAEWRDTALWIEGPTVAQMQQTFAEDWQAAGGPLLGQECFPRIPDYGESAAAFVQSEESAADSGAARMYQVLIASAHERLWIANSYFIPSRAIAERLIEKAKQGVDVRVLAPGKFMDIAPIRVAQRSTYAQLLQGGVRVYEYGPSMLHSKTMLVDDRLVVVGSTNMDPLSLHKTEDASLVVDDRQLAEALASAYLGDLDHSMEIRWDSWRRGGWAEGIFHHLVGIIGGWL